ncbi:MAG: hypothetical protein IPM36_09640 [Lewinellaceae bacterium]|nr:hypothetical protein [Lewinellaceae bacterium]
MKYTFLILGFIALASCTRLALWMYQVKQPALENHQSLTTFLLANEIDTTELLCLKDTTTLNKLLSIGLSIPDSRFFNRNKLMVDYRTSPKDCNGKVSVFIEKADSINLLIPRKEHQLDHYLKNLVHSDTRQTFALEQEPYDVYLVVYWAKFLGKVNKHKVFEWQQLAKAANEKGQKIRMILVNVDYQDFWGIQENQVPKFNY